MSAGDRRRGELREVVTTSVDLGPHVEVRLIGAPAAVDAALAALASVSELSRATRKRSRDHDGRVIQYATVTVPVAGQLGGVS